MSKMLNLLGMGVLFLLLAACNGRNSQQTNDANLQIIVAVQSTIVGKTNLLVTITDAAGNPVNDATIAVKGDMSHAGMVPVLAAAAGGENGVYEMPFEWTMGGDWVVSVEVALPDGRSTTKQFNFTIDS